jgi:hypothetical protein
MIFAPAIRRITAAEWLGQPIWLTLLYGQSRAAGNADGTTNCDVSTTTAEEPELVLRMACPASPGMAFGRDYREEWSHILLPYVDCPPLARFPTPEGLPGFFALGQNHGSSLWWRAAQDRALGRPLKRRVLMAAGVGGRPIADLKKGAPPFVGAFDTFGCYDRMIRMVTRLRDLCLRNHGVPLRIETVRWMQGERDGALGTPEATYEAEQRAMFADLRADLAAICGQAEPFPILFDFVPAQGSGEGNPIAFAQERVALANADGLSYAIGPIYWLGYATASHMSSQGVILLAELFARAEEGLLAGVAPSWLRSAIQIDGSRILVNLIGAQGAAVADTTLLPDPGDLGFRLSGGNGATITGVTVETARIVIQCSAAPGGGASFRYAFDGPGNDDPALDGDLDGNFTNDFGETGRAGAWGNIRDSSAIPSARLSGQFLYRFLSSFRATIA